MRFLLPCLGLTFFFSPVNGQTTAEPPALPPATAPGEEISDYVRFLEGTEKDLLQTAITRFQKGDTIVDLVAVVHLADGSYFENLNQLLATYDSVLYEMVGGAFSPETADELPTGSDEMAGIRQLQTMAKSFLGLEFQLEGIDYGAENFVHADVEWDGLNGLMAARNQNFSEIFSRAMALSAEGSIAGLPDSEAGMSLMLSGLLSAVTSGNSTELKRLLAPLLSEAESFITQLEGDDGTVLVTERNKVVMETLAQVRQAKGGGKYAIFYGAGHMPDLENRLLDLGFAEGETGWVDAWAMEHGTAGASSSPTVEPGDFFLKLLEENPEIIGTLQKMGEMLEQIQPPE
jgi:hypothetical protein